MTSNPWDKFFWNDWENDPALKLCSFAAQGLWMRMLCICAKSEPKGYLMINGDHLTMTEMSSLFGKSEAEIEPLLNELERKGVFSRDKASKIYSRKMIKMEKKARTARDNGKNNGRIGRESEENPAGISGESQENLPENRYSASDSKIKGISASVTKEGTDPPTDPSGSTYHKPEAISQNKKESKQATGSRFALADLPDEWRKFCVEKRPDIDPDELFAEFKDFWAGVPGQRGRKLDWFATWRNRVRDKKSTGGWQTAGNYKSKTDLAMEEYEKKYVKSS